MKNNLAEIVLRNIEFFSLSADSDVHPDAAVQQLEMMASHLKELPTVELSGFFETVSERLEQLRKNGASEEQIALLENLREHLGM
jgi:hypothetical protein